VVLVAPAQYRVFGRFRRAESLARAGRGEQAMTEAESVARIPKLAAGYRYDMACVAALAGVSVGRHVSRPLSRREALRETHGRRAVEWLHQADKAGFFKTKAIRDHVLKDPDLDSLRGRADFKAFVAGLTPKKDE